MTWFILNQSNKNKKVCKQVYIIDIKTRLHLLNAMQSKRLAILTRGKILK